MDFYPFRFDVKRLRPLLQRDLYRNPDVAIRELAQNAHDAIMRRAKIDETFNSEHEGEIVFHINPLGGTLSVSDNGAGMSRDKILDVFRWYGRSDKDTNDEVGTFGIGAKSIFATADSFTIHTRSIETGETLQVYAKLEGLAFQPSPPMRESPGTTITIPSQAKEGSLEKYKDALGRYCRAVRVPIYLEESGKPGRELLSQKAPWHVECTHIPGDGFDIHVAVSSHDDEGRYFFSETSNSLLCVEGFFVSETRYDGALAGVAINLTRKDLVNLTMSRDDAIRDEKYEALSGTVIGTIATHVTKMDFTALDVLKNQAGLIRWLGEHKEDSPLWKQIPSEIQATIRTLTSKICVYPSLDMSWRVQDQHKATLLNVLLAPKPKFFLFGKPRRVVEELAAKKKAIIIYHACAQDRKQLKEHLTKYGISAVADDTKTKRYFICTPGCVNYYGTLDELEAAYPTRTQNDVSLIFPSQTLLCRLEWIARHLNVHATRLKDHEALEGNWLDLRKIQGKEAVFKGKRVRLDLINGDDVAVAPPEFFKFAQAVKRESIIFTQDIASTCLLVSRGVRMIDTGSMEDTLKAALPQEICKEVCWWNLRDANDYRAVASLAASLDWKNPYSSWLFTLASNSDSRHEVATNPVWTVEGIPQ